VENQLKGIFYNCDEKYFYGHKYKEKELCMAISEDILEDDTKSIPQESLSLLVEDNPPSNHSDVEPLISLHALIVIYAPQTLKLIGYIKHCKIIILMKEVALITLFIYR
jgi:hypothetical protein